MRIAPLRNAYAPERDVLSICPHCWEVNMRASRLCGRCGADMHLVLQESGGLRHTAPIQSPVPVRGGPRLSILQRALVLAFVVLIVATQILGVILASTKKATSPLLDRVGAGMIPVVPPPAERPRPSATR